VNPFVRYYIIPDHLNFGFFPWAAFVAFGMSAGSILRRLRTEDVAPVMQWFGWGGLALAFGSWSVSNMPVSIYSNSDFWLNGPALIMIKLGVVLMLLAFSYVWTLQLAPERWSWVRQFGMTSLLVYWVHVELVYGRTLGYFKESLSLTQTGLLAIGVIVLMLALSLVKTNWAAVKTWAGAAGPAAERVSGD
jgi:fucose 4-O-acetylase-like acetyltransferase